MNEDTRDKLLKALNAEQDVKDEISINISRCEREELNNGPTAENTAKLAVLRADLKATNDIIKRLNKDFNAVEIAAKKEELSKTTSDEQELIAEAVIKHNIGYVSTVNHFIYCMGMEEDGSDLINPDFTQIDAGKMGNVLNQMCNKRLVLSSRAMLGDLIDYFRISKNIYYKTTASFNNEKWGRHKAYNKASVIRKFWVQPDYDNMDDYSTHIDFLIHCIGGGKQENIDHLEQWIAYKWMYPERCGNTPNLDIGGFPGGNGKGRYIEMVKTVFTSKCVVAAALKELCDGFNANWELATLLYYDEPGANELPENKLKQATGSEDMRSEKKGVDATMVDRNYNMLFMSNNPNGVVKLSGTGAGGEDRRYSVLITDKVMTDEAIAMGVVKDMNEAKIFVNEVNNTIKDRKEVGKWLAYIIKKHDIENMSVLHALHGEDYHARFEDQKTNIATTFDLLLPIYQANKCITSKHLFEIVKAISGYDKLTNKGCTAQFKQYLARNKIEFELKQARIRHVYDGDISWECSAKSFVTGDGPYIFDHTDICKTIPLKTMEYNSMNIKLGNDSSDDDIIDQGWSNFKP